MDIQVSSNFERLLFEALGRDGAAVTRLMQSLSQSGSFAVPEAALAQIRAEFAAGRTGEAETAEAIRSTYEKSGYLPDPHTAVGLAQARRIAGAKNPIVTLATAHPAKFPDAVKQATGVEPGLPVWLADLYGRVERYDILDNDQTKVEAFILERTRTVA
jgi:threonine synthase